MKGVKILGIFKRSTDSHDKTKNLDYKTRRRLKKEQKERDAGLYVRDHPLRDLFFRNGFKFHSNYFEHGDRFYRIITLIEPLEADRALVRMWHVNMYPMPSVLNDPNDMHDEGSVHGVHGQFFEMYENKPKSWFDKKLGDIDRKANQEEATAEGIKQVRKLSIRKQDIAIITDDYFMNDMYASTEYKVLLSAKSLHDLDIATFRYQQHIEGRFDGIHFEVYEGQQRQDYTNLLRTADVQLGMHPMATSSEYAGGYSILSRGVTDPNGDYIGQMYGDINNTAVLMDLDNYDNRVIFGSNADPEMLKYTSADFDQGTKSSTVFGVRLAQSALINNHRVIHLVLNDSKPQNIGANLDDITTMVSMNHGAINPFEIFGEIKDGKVVDELDLFPSHSLKIRNMIKQISPSIDDVDLNKTFTDVFKNFYYDEGMLVDNPKENQDKLRLAGLPHDQYPLLEKFVAYLNLEYENANKRHDSVKAARLERLESAFTTMLVDNSSIFNSKTDMTVDNTENSPQVIYDFSGIKRNRGIGVAMAQLINVIRYATASLDRRDVLIIHGADNIADATKEYLKDVFVGLRDKGVRLAFLYDSVESAIDDSVFNDFDSADYSVLGMMSKSLINKYQNMRQRALPNALTNTIVELNDDQHSSIYYYLSRRLDNVIFALDLVLGTRNGDFVSENPRGLSLYGSGSDNNRG